MTTEVTEDFVNEQLKVRIWIGKRSAVFAVYNADLERVQGDRTVAKKLSGSGCAGGDPDLRSNGSGSHL